MQLVPLESLQQIMKNVNMPTYNQIQWKARTSENSRFSEVRLSRDFLWDVFSKIWNLRTHYTLLKVQERIHRPNSTEKRKQSFSHHPSSLYWRTKWCELEDIWKLERERPWKCHKGMIRTSKSSKNGHLVPKKIMRF